jgi:Family of unknown function (DUF6461)
VRAIDYNWFPLLFPDLAGAYCVTLVRGVSPQAFLGQVGATASPCEVKGVDALVAARGRSPGFVAVTAVPSAGVGALPLAPLAGTWTLAVEPGGALGTTASAVRPMSWGTRLVSHSRDAAAVDQFLWLENESTRLAFQPLFPWRRSGSDAHEHVALMREAGFAVDPDDEYRQGMQAGAAFALAEHLTGVRVTIDLLDDTVYECAVVPGGRVVS